MYQQWSWCRLRGPLRVWCHAHRHSWRRVDTPTLSLPKRSLVLGSKVYSNIVDADTLRYSVMKEEEVEEVLTFVAEHFFPRSVLINGLHMSGGDNKYLISGWMQEWARSGVSVLVRDPATDQLCGAILASILTREQANIFHQIDNSTNTKVKTWNTIISVLETAVDFFDRYENVDRICKMAFVTVPEKFARCGVGLRLIQEGESRSRHLGCQLATGNATAASSQRLLYRLGYTSLYTMDYKTFEIAGKRVFDVDKMLGTPSAKVMARLLKAEDEQPSPME